MSAGRGLARAAAVLTVVLGLFLLASVAWRTPPAPAEPAAALDTAAPAPPHASAAAPASPASPAAAAPAPTVVDRSDRMPEFLQALTSDDPAVITRGLLAAHECGFFTYNDPNNFQGMPAIGPDADDADRRREALAIAQQRCGRFTLQRETTELVSRLRARLQSLRPEVDADLATLRAWVADPRGPAAARDAGCTVLEKSLNDPWLAWRAGFELRRLLPHRSARPPEDLAVMATLAHERLLCTAQGRCDQPRTDELTACAFFGFCGAGGFIPPFLADPQALVQEARAVVQAIADGRCRDTWR